MLLWRVSRLLLRLPRLLSPGLPQQPALLGALPLWSLGVPLCLLPWARLRSIGVVSLPALLRQVLLLLLELLGYPLLRGVVLWRLGLSALLLQVVWLLLRLRLLLPLRLVLLVLLVRLPVRLLCGLLRGLLCLLLWRV